MGRVNANPVQQLPREAISSEQQIQHFSHPHALHLTNQPQNPNTPCFACKSPISGPTYSCFPCSYFLHPSCSKLPRKIKHPYDASGHTLYLLPVPSYPEGSFRCDACGKNGTGFCYNCALCGIDLHTTCAATPLSVMHGTHVHQLDLTFLPPYHNKSFSCDLCRMAGSNHWLYRCHSCEFDVHLDCGMGKVYRAAPIQGQPTRVMNNNQQYYPNHGVQYQQPIPLNPGVQYQQPIPLNPGVQYQTPRPLNLGVQYQQTGQPHLGVQYQKPGLSGNYGPVRPNPGQGYRPNAMVNNGVQGFVNGASQAVGQVLMTGVLGTVGLGVSAGGGAAAGGGGAAAGGGGAYYDGGYTEMNDPGTIQDSSDSME